MYSILFYVEFLWMLLSYFHLFSNCYIIRLTWEKRLSWFLILDSSKSIKNHQNRLKIFHWEFTFSISYSSEIKMAFSSQEAPVRHHFRLNSVKSYEPVILDSKLQVVLKTCKSIPTRKYLLHLHQIFLFLTAKYRRVSWFTFWQFHSTKAVNVFQIKRRRFKS